ncbi:MAG TPA: DUF2752 domain-containing protein [Bacteroidales bacterium]|nr:DUF2752 domain-containing protein [Bacteroidales bacterium]
MTHLSAHIPLWKFTRSAFWRTREAWFWLIALALMASMDPLHPHATLCPLGAMGVAWCPGCGLGHSIAWLFRAGPGRSFQEHWLGIPAIIIILSRIITIFRTHYKSPCHGTSAPLHP